MKKLFGFLLMICGLCIFTGSVANSSVGGWFSDRERYVKEFPGDGIESIEINATADIHIIPHQQKNIKTVVDGKGAADMDVTIRRQGEELYISADPKWYHWLFRNKPELKVYVPESYKQHMNIHSIAGDVRFYGASPGQRMKLREFEVDITAGNVDLQNLQVDDLQYSNLAGDLRIQRVTAKAADIYSGSGDVKLDHFTGSFRASLPLGKLTGQIDSLTGEIRAKMTSGEMALDLPPDADFTLRARVTSGEIECGLPCQKVNKEWETTATATNGKGKHAVTLDSVSGHIRVY